jgi:hypothetical protein
MSSVTFVGRIFVSYFIFTNFSGVASAAATEQSFGAFYIAPMELQIRPNSAAPAMLEVFNKEEHEAEIHVDIFERTETLAGAESRSLSNDIVVDSSDFKLPSGKSRRLILRYRGSKNIARERAFRVVVRQLGTNDEKSLDLRYVYVASLYVTPISAQSNLMITSIKKTSDREVEVNLHNEGRAHTFLSDFSPIILQTSENNSTRTLRVIKLSAESREAWSKQNLLAGSRRNLVLQIARDENPIQDGALSLKLAKP